LFRLLQVHFLGIIGDVEVCDLSQCHFVILQKRRDGTNMSLAQSKKMSQLSADNAQWEDRQLLRSGAVRGTEQQTEFDDEDENRVILLVHGKCDPGSVIYVLFHLQSIMDCHFDLWSDM
jgi:hypothetical protein